MKPEVVSLRKSAVEVFVLWGCHAAWMADRCPTFGESVVVSSSRLHNVHEECSCGCNDYFYYHIYLGNQSHHCRLVAMITRIRQVLNSTVIVYFAALSNP